MKFRRKGQAGILLILCTLSMISVSFSAWVLGESTKGETNIEVNVGPSNYLGDYVKVIKTLPIKFCKDGFINKEGEVDFYRGVMSIDLQVNAIEIRNFYNNPTKTDFYISTKIANNVNNKLDYNLINDKIKYELSASLDSTSYQILDNSKPTLLNGVAATKDINLDNYFKQNLFYLRLEYFFDVYDYLYDHELGFDYDKFEKNFVDTTDITKNLSKVKYDISLTLGARS